MWSRLVLIVGRAGRAALGTQAGGGEVMETAHAEFQSAVTAVTAVSTAVPKHLAHQH